MKPRSKRSPSQSADEKFLGFTNSVREDERLWKYDIAGSIAHAHTLANAGILSKKELALSVDALKAIGKRLQEGSVELDPTLEDVHMNIEDMLIHEVGDLGRKLHTGRSRNDQVALDLRLWVRDALAETAILCDNMQATLLARAQECSGIVMPGYTHLQHAQPVSLSHHLLAHFWKIQRDIERMRGCYLRTNVSPLGSAALAGTTFKLDRTIAQNLLGMSGITENSLDAVSDRDFAAEAAFTLSLLMIHLSSLSEEMILWSSTEFGFVMLPKNLSSGSSIMPQKRNPDLLELARAKSSRAIGDLVTILTLLKSLPLAYNRDLQEGKVSLFDVFDIAKASLHALTCFLQAVKFDKARMRKAAEAGLMTATDLADFLTTTGVPFRTAHGMVQDIAEKSGGDEKKFIALANNIVCHQLKDFKTSDLGFMSASKSVDRRDIAGGTGGSAVARQMEDAQATVQNNNTEIQKMTRSASCVNQLLK
jgi:argininosuccinate lyase